MQTEPGSTTAPSPEPADHAAPRGSLAPFVWTVLSASLHALAFPPWDFTAVAFVALVPFLAAIRGVSPRRAALLGHVWGSVAIWAVGYWVAEGIAVYYEQPLWFGILFCLVGCQILWGLYYAAFAYGARRFTAGLTPSGRVLAIGLLWTACELARARALTAEPWMLLGYSLVPHPLLLQLAAVGGVYLLSFGVILCNAAIAELVLPARAGTRPWGVLGFPAAVAAAMMLYAAFGTPERPPGRDAEVAIVQGNNELESQWRIGAQGKSLEAYLRLSARSASARAADLIVWPESAVTFAPPDEPLFMETIARLARHSGAALVIGAPFRAAGPRGPVYNSAYHVAASGEITSRYDKVRLMPFAEYFPLRFMTFLQRDFGAVDSFAPGAEGVLLQTAFGPAAVVICFEAIFPELVLARTRLGARILINLSNDIWLGNGTGQSQHLAMVVLRAVENRLWVLRATTTGISALIDPGGRIVAASELNREAVLRGTVAFAAADTFYQRHGDLFAVLCCLGALVLAIGVLATERGRASLGR